MLIRSVIFILLACCLSEGLLAQRAEKGLLDLRDTDISTNTVLLNGEWEFYWDELLTSVELDSTQDKDYYEFPKLWNEGYTLNGKKLEVNGFGTYRLTLLLPEGRMPTVYIKHFYCAYNLFCNGELIVSNGMVGKARDSYVPAWVPTKAGLTVENGKAVLDLQIANFSHRKGGAREPIQLSSKARIDQKSNLIFGFDLLLAGSLIMAGLFFLGLYFFGTKQVFVLYFSLFCLTFSHRIVAADDYTLHMLYSGINWFIAVKLEYLSLFVPLIFFSLYTDSLFPEDSKYWVLRGLAIVSSLFCLFILFTPARIFTSYISVYLLVMLIGVFSSGWVYFGALSNKRDGANYAVISSGILFLVVVYKIMEYTGLVGEEEIISFLGYIFFFFFQSLIIFFLFTNSLKKAKIQAEIASKSKSEFLSMMSHEIRTPMNAVIGLTNYLIEEEPKPDQVETLNTLKFSAKNLLVIINDILDFSKIEAKKMEFESQSIDLQSLALSLNRVFQPSVVDKNLELVFNIDPRIPPYVFCDPTRTSQILTNLINNAIKFTDEGEVTVSLDIADISADHVRVRFSVTDTGIGIEKAKQAEIFKSFTQASSSTTRRFGGTGLGLSITKKLLQLQGSDLQLNSTPGKGSTFFFVQSFDIDKSKNDMVEPVVEHASKASANSEINAKILVVEDNQINVLVVSKFLKKWGVQILVAKNGQEALDVCEVEMDIDLILMDIQMPVMDGLEASKKLRSKGLRIPIIALTASALLEDQAKISRAGMDDFVTKPFDPKDLKMKILSHLKL